MYQYSFVYSYYKFFLTATLMISSICAALLVIHTLSKIENKNINKINIKTFSIMIHSFFCIYFVIVFLFTVAPPKEFIYFFNLQNFIETILVVLLLIEVSSSFKKGNLRLLLLSYLIIYVISIFTNSIHHYINTYVDDFQIQYGILFYTYKIINYFIIGVVCFLYLNNGESIFNRYFTLFSYISFITLDIIFVFITKDIYSFAPVAFLLIELSFSFRQKGLYTNNFLESSRKKSLDLIDHLLVIENLNGKVVYINNERYLDMPIYTNLRNRMNESSGVIKHNEKFYRYDINPFNNEKMNVAGYVVTIIDFTEQMNLINDLEERNSFLEEVNIELNKHERIILNLSKHQEEEGALFDEINNILDEAIKKIVSDLEDSNTQITVSLKNSLNIIDQTLNNIRKIVSILNNRSF